MKAYNYPEVAVGAFILNKKGELLLAKSYKWPESYMVPGGHIEIGESVKEATIREVMEEVGLKVKFKRVINVQEAIYPKGFHSKRHFIFIDVLCFSNSDKAKVDNKEINGFVWASPKGALKMKTNPYTKRAIKQIVNKKQTKWFYS